MARTPVLLPPPPVPMRARLRRPPAYPAWTWSGRILLAALVAWFLAEARVPLPCGLDVLATLTLFFYSVWGLFRLGRYLVRRLMWRIRTKLIVSYLFIAVVPVVLLLLLFA